MVRDIVSIREQSHVPGPGKKVRCETSRVIAMCEHRDSFTFHFITIAIGTVEYARTIKLAEPRTVWRQIPQTRREQQSPRVERLLFSSITTNRDPKALSRNLLDRGYTRLDNQPTVSSHFITASGQEFVRTDPVVSEKAVHAVRVFIPRAVVMKRECPVKIARQEERRRQARRPRADDDAVVGLILDR